MDVCLPEDFLRLTCNEPTDDANRRDEWLGAEAWISGVPQRAAGKRTMPNDDPTWMVS